MDMKLRMNKSKKYSLKLKNVVKKIIKMIQIFWKEKVQ